MTLTGIAFVAIYLGGLLLALGRHPIFGLVAYMITFYLHPPGRWWGAGLPDLRWSLAAAIVTYIAFLFHSSKARPQAPFMQSGISKALLAFTIWLWVQTGWAMDAASHLELSVLYTKYLVLLFLVYRILDSPAKLGIFLWVHVAGCFVMGWDAYTSYDGGRFEGFVPPNLNEANAGALNLVTGVYVIAALFLFGRWKAKGVLIGAMVFVLNGIITTISRSGFLELGVAGLIFGFFTPREKKSVVAGLAVLGLMAFIYLTNGVYWNRIDSLSSVGQEAVVDVNTGQDRIALMKAQIRMFEDYPLGTGHRGTVVLSTLYLDDRFMTTDAKGNRARSSHNTFLTLAVEQGVIGAIFYFYMMWWSAITIFRTTKIVRGGDKLVELSLVAVAAGLGAIFIGDMFVDYLKLEVRYWFLGILLVLPSISRLETESGVVKRKSDTQLDRYGRPF
ncbi:MAG: hypothetical protein ACI915_005497 [Gammaproteobacteria bacterium]